jgi:hypothetical protein
MTIENRIKSELLLVASTVAAERLPDRFVIATWSNLTHPGAVPFPGIASRAWPLPELSDSEKTAVLDQYHDAIASVGLENGPNSLWWYTWTSSRDRFHSRILGDMELLARLSKACEEGPPRHLALVCTDPYLASALIDNAKRKGINGHREIDCRLRWTWQRIRMNAAPLVSGFRACQQAFIQKHRIGRKSIPLELGDGVQERTLIVTWLKAKNLQEGGPTTDTFFGQLPEFIRADNRSVVLFGDLLDTPNAPITKWQVNPSLPVLAAGDFYGASAIFTALFHGLFSPIKLPNDLEGEGTALASLIRRDIHNNRGAVVYGLLFESALRRLCSIIHPTQIIHSGENNPWERACVRVARTMSPEPRVTGFMHCAVLLSHPKIIITDKEKPVRPRPQKLVCTGPRARDIMIHHGGHSPDEVVAGCALRHEYLWQMQPREGVNRDVRSILVALDGLPTMPGLVRFILDALDGESSYRTVLRPHPIDTPERVMADASIPMSALQTLRFSNGQSVAADLQEADLLIYKGSTLAIEAGYLGIPLIHWDSQSLLNNDPLFEVTSLKEVVRTPDELVSAVQRFSAMDNEEYLKQRDELAEYINQYFVRPTIESADIYVGRETEESRG